MNAKDLLKYNIDFTHSVTQAYVSDITDEEMVARAIPGSNHIAWQLGHLVSSERQLFTAVGCDMPELPDGFDEGHSDDTRESDDAGRFLTKDQYLDFMDTMHTAAKNAIDSFDEDDLDNPAPEKMRDFFPTVGSVLMMGGSHEMMHVGQIAAIRRKLGKPIVI
ncbi:MAG: DinB family protein [Planctomycetes bacterium]|nr:DinB family protein [Planctomycetota bacterium]